MTTDVDPYREWDAAYVLGALGPQERRDYEQHLATCPTCREAVAELAGMPGLLGLLTPEEAAGPPVPAVVDLPTVARAAERRRTRARLVQLAAAVLLLVGGLGAGLALAGDEAPQTTAGRTVELAPVDSSAVEATLTMSARAWGTALAWHCTYPPHESWAEPVVYTLVVVEADGTRSVAATWSAGAGAATGLSASTSVPAARIARVEIGVLGSDAALAGARV
ncbi:MAG TPA: zf-HC2 domain-containing protein [Cellulomonas sp.]|nr:zf-HC2 domain-containing protein [Cellulomonas sp.]